MRLSEAIRLGAMLMPQAFRGLHRDGGSCALGAALDAIGCTDKDGYARELKLFDGALAIGRVECRQCGVTGPLDAMVVHLNDQHRWTREAIADWVETLERREESTAVAVVLDLLWTKRELPPSLAAVDPHASDPGTPTPREEHSSRSSSSAAEP